MGTHYNILAWRIPMDSGAWRATAHGIAESRTRPSEHSTAFLLFSQIYFNLHLFSQIFSYTIMHNFCSFSADYYLPLIKSLC